LRPIDCWLVRKAFFTNCWVIVEPPWDDALVRDVGPEGARHAADVDAAMLVEALVLDRDDRVPEPRGHRGRRDDDPRLRATQDREHRVAVRGVDVGVRLGVLLRRVELRDLGSDRGQETRR